MDKLEIKYRLWHKGVPPRQIKLQIPGWSGEQNSHTDGDKPQPWHCPPFVDGATYGLELYYPFETECHVRLVDGKVVFEGDFDKDQIQCPDVKLPPFMSFAPGHFGMTSALDIQVPTGYVLRTEPHPRYYTSECNTVPCCIPGHIQTEWWPKFFFVVFKNPLPGQTIIFRQGEPYGQILIISKKISYDIKEMTLGESLERADCDNKINKYCKRFVKNDWHDHLGHNFDDKYKVLSSICSKHGADSVKDFIKSVAKKIEEKKKIPFKFFKKGKNEKL